MSAIISNETFYDDGAYVATVKAYGFEYAAHFISGEIRLYGIGSKNKNTTSRIPSWQRNGAAKAAKAAVQASIDAKGSEWMERHKKLYAE